MVKSRSAYSIPGKVGKTEKHSTIVKSRKSRKICEKSMPKPFIKHAFWQAFPALAAEITLTHKKPGITKNMGITGKSLKKHRIYM